MSNPNHDGFKTIQVITLNSYLQEVALTKAWDLIDNINDLQHQAALIYAKLCCQSKHEFVDVGAEFTIVGLNVAKIDDLAIYRAFQLISLLEDPQKIGYYEFGSDISHEECTTPPVQHTQHTRQPAMEWS